VKKVLAVFFAILFVCCVVSYGENKRFSAELMLNNLTNFGDMPSLDRVVDCWTEDGIWIDTSTGSVIGGKWIYFENYDGNTEVLQFFDFVRGFFLRLYYSISILIDMFICILDNVEYLLPWNNTVEVTT